MNRLSRLGFVLAALLAIALASCSREGGQKGPPGGGAVPVSAAAAGTETVPIHVDAIGNVEAYSTVQVRPQISGTLTSVRFREGQAVRQGDLLFELDPRPFQAAVSQAQGNLERDRARAADAASTLQRYESLVKKEYITQQQYDAARADAEASKATVRSDEAALDTAKLNLSYCTIKAPLAGRTGALLVHAGNVVNPSNALVVINQVQPVNVNFTVPQSMLSAIRVRGGEQLPVMAQLGGGGEGGASAPYGTPSSQGPGGTGGAGGPIEIKDGHLTFIDNGVNPVTGTVLLKATFPNRNEALWPGQFVQVVLTLGERQGVVIPAQAVQTGQAGSYVFVVKPDGTAESRPVQVSSVEGGRAVVDKGVSAGEQVVTDGQLRLHPGARVQVKQAGAGR